MAPWKLATGSKLIAALAIAQFLAFLLCITGLTSSVLVQRSVFAPASQSVLNYAVLALTCGLVHLRSHGWKWCSTNPWYIYLLLAFLDVQGNFLVTKAYQYTSITSVTLLDCFTIPAVMCLSVVVFRSKYKVGHICGALTCVAGLAVLVLTDTKSDTGGPNPVLGDILVLCGACVYAICNVSQERLLCTTSRWELLACVGGFSTLIGGVQAAVLEHAAWAEGNWDGAAIGAFLGFSGALYCFALLIPLVLMWGGSTVLNLSLLTSDLWAAGARGLFFGGFGGTGGFFAAALLMETAGIAMYTAAGEEHRHDGTAVQDTGSSSGSCLLQHQQSDPGSGAADEHVSLLAGFDGVSTSPSSVRSQDSAQAV